MYYNQIVEKKLKNEPIKRADKKVSASFASQKVDFSDYLVAPEGYEAVVYPLYFLSIPYITGAVFLFLFIAGGSFTNFKLLDTSAFLIVWMIGYEIVATVLLIAIFISFLKHDNKPNNGTRY
jgi:small-conductance mechanosensitive channel